MDIENCENAVYQKLLKDSMEISDINSNFSPFFETNKSTKKSIEEQFQSA